MIVRSALSRPWAGDLGRLDRTFEQLTAGLFSPAPGRRMPEITGRWDHTDHGEALVLTVDLPGVAAEAVSVEVAGRTLTLGVETADLHWSRSLQLGTSLDTEAVTARHVDGRLTVRVEPVAAPEHRTIAIDTTPVHEALAHDTGATNETADDQSTGTSSGSDHPES